MGLPTYSLLLPLLILFLPTNIASFEYGDAEFDESFDYADDYPGDLDPDGMLGSGRNNFKTVETVEDLDAFLASSPTDPHVVGVFAPGAASEKLAFEQFCNQYAHSGLVFAVAGSDAICEKLKVEGFKVFVYPPPRLRVAGYDGGARKRYPGSRIEGSEDALASFIFKSALPRVGKYTLDSLSLYEKNRGITVVVYAKGFSWSTLTSEKSIYDYYARRIARVGADYPSLRFAVAQWDEYEHSLPRFFDPADISWQGSKAVVGVIEEAGANDKYFGKPVKFSEAELRLFVEEYVGGSLLPRIHARRPAGGDDESPASDFEKTVEHVTPDSFDAVVSSEENILINFYAPWCGHCMALKPEYAKVAAHFAAKGGVRVLAFDASEHDPPHPYAVEGYPTIVFKPRGEDPHVYEGAREAGEIIHYVESLMQSPRSGDESE